MFHHMPFSIYYHFHIPFVFSPSFSLFTRICGWTATMGECLGQDVFDRMPERARPGEVKALLSLVSCGCLSGTKTTSNAGKASCSSKNSNSYLFSKIKVDSNNKQDRGQYENKTGWLQSSGLIWGITRKCGNKQLYPLSVPSYHHLACIAGVLLGRVSVTTLRPPC